MQTSMGVVAFEQGLGEGLHVEERRGKDVLY